MVAFLSVADGHDVSYLTDQVSSGRESYYTAAVDAGEPPGLWYGRGAEQLGLAGEVNADLLEAMYLHNLDPRDANAHNRSTWGLAETLGSKPKAFRPPEELYREYLANEVAAAGGDVGPERCAELRRLADRHAKQNVPFTDFTFSPQKSITVAAVAYERAANEARTRGDLEEAAEWDRKHRLVEEAVLAGARASVDYLQEHAAYGRRGKHGGGAGRWTDAPNLTVAQFLQHDSREHDPQLHVHQAIWSQARGADGEYTKLDGRVMKAARPAAEAVGGRVMEARLARELGWRFETRPDGVREVVGVDPALCEQMSRRATAITGKTAELVEAFEARFGREPSSPELNTLKQRATMATRAAKSHTGETREQMLDRWERETREGVGVGLGEVAANLAGANLANPGDAVAEGFAPQDVIERAVAAVAERRGSWTRADLMGAIADALPANLGVDEARIPALLGRLTDAAIRTVRSTRPANRGGANLPGELRLPDGGSVFVQPGQARFAAEHQPAAERESRRAAVRRGAFAVPRESANALVGGYSRGGFALGEDQAAAVRGVLTSGAEVEVLSAPAGTGKSVVVGALADAWGANGKQVFGLAPSQVAADVLTDEGVPAANVDRWIRAQERIANGRERDGDSRWRMRPGAIVVIDEAGMATTEQVRAVQRRCANLGAKLLLVGDPRQLGAVGPGGALADIADHGIRYELAEVRRFAEPWEREASLRLRDGDDTVADEYLKRGRLLGHGTAERAEQEALRAWLADTTSGREALLLAGSNKAAARLAGRAREEMIRLGLLAAGGPEVALERDGNTAGVGDLVQARRNNWDLRDEHGRAAVNRAMYRISEVADDGSVAVLPVLGRGDGGERLGEPMRLPADYARSNLALGYASTVHAAQGRTVDTCHAVIGRKTDTAAAYVALTRGRLGNWAHVITRPAHEENPAGEVQAVEARAARGVLADLLASGKEQRSVLQEMAANEEAERSAFTNVGQLLDVAAQCTAGRTSRILDRLAAEGVLSEEDRVRLAADEAVGAVDRALRTAELAGRDREDVLRQALAAGDLADARSAGQVLYKRVRDAAKDDLVPHLAAFSDLVPAEGSEEMRAWLQDRADVADDRRRELGARTAQDQPAWAVDALGPVPTDVVDRAAWEHKAGWAAAYREIAQHDDDQDALGAPPPAGLAEKYAIWRTAHQHLDLPDAGAAEKELTDGQLRARVHAYDREQAWAPLYVADELAETHRRAEQRRVDAGLWSARAGQLTGAEAQELADAAAAARVEAQELAERAAELEQVDDARARWYADTAVTRDNGTRARAELGHRGVDLAGEEKVTAEEWLAAHEQDQAVEDPARAITETDLDDTTAVGDAAAAPAVLDPDETLETAVPDARDLPPAAPIERDKVPTLEETRAAVERAQEAAAELTARRAVDARRAVEEVDDRASHHAAPVDTSAAVDV